MKNDNTAGYLPTRSSLLHRLKDVDDDESWRLFDAMYRKMLHGFARKAGLNEAAAEEVVQDTMIVVAKTMPQFKYQPERCSFKGWLLQLTRQRIADHLRRQYRQGPKGDAGLPSHAGEGTLEEVPDPSAFPRTEEWEQEWQERLLDAALERVKEQATPKQFQMFHLFTLKQWPAAKVAATMNVSQAVVYMAKLRMSARLKKELQALKAKWE
jgi:RNA polymerase sigma-70 factor, ECF subfamily